MNVPARILSGIQPTGLPHLGNYFGAMKQHVEAATSASGCGDALFFIADLHALTTVRDRRLLPEQVRATAATYLALGLDVTRAAFFRQSDVPEVTELAWLLACTTGMGLLQRGHSFKDKTQHGLSASVGLFTYPILMAADILIYDTDIVPVGQDQIQHVEMAQDMATHFNTTFSAQCLKKPAHRLSPTPLVPGLDGEKMSKSYKNTIWIFEEGKALEKCTNLITTDSRTPNDPKDPDSLNVYLILELFLDTDERKEWRDRLLKGGVSYGEIKLAIRTKMNDRFGPARDRYRALMTTPAGAEEVDDALLTGGKVARPLAQATLARCYDFAGVTSAKLRLLAR
jgi:tryptophanyl-tRNA synthetase